MGWDFPIRVVFVFVLHQNKPMITLERLQEIIAATGIELKDGQINPEKTFQENGIDSLDTMTLLLNIEEATDLKFSENEVETISCPNDVLLIVNEKQGRV